MHYSALIHPCLFKLQIPTAPPPPSFFFHSLTGLKDFQPRAALFTLYSQVRHFHLNEAAVWFKYELFKQTCFCETFSPAVLPIPLDPPASVAAHACALSTGDHMHVRAQPGVCICYQKKKKSAGTVSAFVPGGVIERDV